MLFLGFDRRDYISSRYLFDYLIYFQYVAMSLMQQGKLSSSRRIIEAVYRKFSTLDKMNHRTEDEKILKMCLGIWARLMHVWNSRKRKLA